MYRFNFYPLDTCISLSSGFYKLTCSNGVVQETEYTGANCNFISSPSSSYPTGCSSSSKVTCNSAPTTPTAPSTALKVIDNPVVIYQLYSTGCATSEGYTVGFVQGLCIDDSNSTSTESYKVTCSNSVVSENIYTGTTECTGTPSRPDQYLANQCTR